MAREYVPSGRRAGHNAKFLTNVVFEEEFGTLLDELRARLNIEVAPPFPAGK